MSNKKILQNNVKKFNGLIKNIAQNNKDSLEDFYGIYGQMIYITAKTIVKSSVKADEVVNDVLLKIYQMASSLKRINNPEGWLYIITVNCAKDKIKHENNYEEIFDIAVTDKQIDALSTAYPHIVYRKLLVPIKPRRLWSMRKILCLNTA